jgi:hypothetical protein
MPRHVTSPDLRSCVFAFVSRTAAGDVDRATALWYALQAAKPQTAKNKKTSEKIDFFLFYI